MHNQANTEAECFTVSKSGAYAGYVWWHEHPFWASDCLVVRSLNEEEFITFYLFLCMTAKQEEIYSRQQGTGQAHIYEEHIADFPIPKLSISEQRSVINEAHNVIRHRVDAERKEASTLKKTLIVIGDLYARNGMNGEDQ